MARTKSIARLATDANSAIRRQLEIMVAQAQRVRPRRTNWTPDSPVHISTIVVDTLFTEGVSPTREGEGGRGEPSKVRRTGVSEATVDEPPRFARPRQLYGLVKRNRKRVQLRLRTTRWSTGGGSRKWRNSWDTNITTRKPYSNQQKFQQIPVETDKVLKRTVCWFGPIGSNNFLLKRTMSSCPFQQKFLTYICYNP